MHGTWCWAAQVCTQHQLPHQSPLCPGNLVPAQPCPGRQLVPQQPPQIQGYPRVGDSSFSPTLSWGCQTRWDLGGRAHRPAGVPCNHNPSIPSCVFPYYCPAGSALPRACPGGSEALNVSGLRVSEEISCRLCEAGTYRSQALDILPCQPCPPGFSCPQGEFREAWWE